MGLVPVAAMIAGGAPLLLAWRAFANTTLRHTLAWAITAWAAAAWATWADFAEENGASNLARYFALCLAGCAGVAVLGARRPGVGAWHFVVIGLLIVLLLPVAEGFGEPRLRGPYVAFLAVALAFPVVNYLPTSLGPAATMVGSSWGLQLARLLGTGDWTWTALPAACLLAAAPWVAWISFASAQRRRRSEFEREWRAFRDRFGFVWSQRTIEQFNRAAAHAGWPVVLAWKGLSPQADGAAPTEAQTLELLRSVLKRFTTEKASA